MIDIPALLEITVGYILSVGGFLGSSRVRPSQSDRQDAPVSDEPRDSRVWDAAFAEAGPWVFAAGITELLAGVVLFDMKAGEPWIPVLIVGTAFTLTLLGIAVQTGRRAATGCQGDR